MKKLDLRRCQIPKNAYERGGNERVDTPNHLGADPSERRKDL